MFDKLALIGIGLIGFINFIVSFSLSLGLAMRSRGIPYRELLPIGRAVWSLHPLIKDAANQVEILVFGMEGNGRHGVSLMRSVGTKELRTLRLHMLLRRGKGFPQVSLVLPLSPQIELTRGNA